MEHGTFTKEADGRLSGHKIYIVDRRADGRIKVTHAFGSGKRINKIYTPEQLAVEIAKVTKQA